MDTSDFAALRTKDGARRAAFDLLNVDGEDFRELPLEVRRAELEALIEPDGGIMISEAIEDDGALAFAKARELSVEGIVSRRLGGAYWSRPSRNWLKVKRMLSLSATCRRLRG